LRHVVLTFVDISSLRAMQASKRRCKSQLAQSQKMEALGTLAGGVAHDFNNILAAILGNADLARHDLARDAPARESLHEISTAARRGRELVRQILAFSRQQPMVRGRCEWPCGGRVLQPAACRHAAAGGAGAVLCDGHTPPVMADATQLGQVLLNLGTNAVSRPAGATRAHRVSGGRAARTTRRCPPSWRRPA
jgi:two-component system, cell cycle sensor histidine kinase and response regulator CckA